jgi:hypothetical protein
MARPGGWTRTARPSRPLDGELLGQECPICQPAAFIRRDVFEKAGGMNPGLQVAFDYELWMRIARLRPMVKIGQWLATSRMHPRNKTLGQRKRLYLETFRILLENYQYVPFRWLYSYACYSIHKRDEFFEPFRPSVRGYLYSLILGIWYDRQRLRRFLGEWAPAMSLGGLVRWWRTTRPGAGPRA